MMQAGLRASGNISGTVQQTRPQVQQYQPQVQQTQYQPQARPQTQYQPQAQLQSRTQYQASVSTQPAAQRYQPHVQSAIQPPVQTRVQPVQTQTQPQSQPVATRTQNLLCIQPLTARAVGQPVHSGNVASQTLTNPSVMVQQTSLDDGSYLLEENEEEKQGSVGSNPSLCSSGNREMVKGDLNLYVTLRKTFIRASPEKTSALLNVLNGGEQIQIAFTQEVSGVQRAYIVYPMQGWISMATRAGQLVKKMTAEQTMPCVALNNLPATSTSQQIMDCFSDYKFQFVQRIVNSENQTTSALMYFDNHDDALQACIARIKIESKAIHISWSDNYQKIIRLKYNTTKSTNI